MEAPQLEMVKQQFIEEEVVVLTAGKSWGQPYTCEEWATSFGLTIPVLDDENDSLSSIFGNSIPYNVVIDGNGQVIYSAPGHTLETIVSTIEDGLSTIIQDSDNDSILDNIDNCINIYNPEQNDYDFDSIGDECDSCDNLNIFISGNVYGDIDDENNFSIDIFDLLTLLDIIIYDYDNVCGYQIADITGDSQQNILDAIALIQSIMSQENH